jgi:predicted transposase/invertase (TIGR01784 family)
MSGNIHDSFFKGMFSVRENLQDLVRGPLPPQILGKVQFDTLEFERTSYVDSEMRSFFSDLCCNVLYGDKQIKISFLFEHKSHYRKNIHLQLLQYILNIWERQADNGEELIPVICIVFYHGKRKWKHTNLLKDVSVELRRYVPMFDYVFFDTKDIGDLAISDRFMVTGVRIAVWSMKRSDNLMEFIRENPSIVSEIFGDLSTIDEGSVKRIIVYLQNNSGKDPDIINEVMKAVSPESRDILELYSSTYFDQGMEKGIEQGLEQGLVRTAMNMIRKGYSDKEIAEVTSLTVSRVQSLRKS